MSICFALQSFEYACKNHCHIHEYIIWATSEGEIITVENYLVVIEVDCQTYFDID